ncbi:CBS domain-containing protein [Paractinoplanes rishiriensis]|uniref:CBS domain-containing protein n=1 Tax=Paractinoplanes rishiriensis TaxID=1050105 RepID=A0A919KD28_9ACTN|nr:CBS domain-containing protein [Actinoplanes rishiriensis]GIF01742.1 hypothetical protein Ari01nite_92060 [Actinoplanes rishiriensis]
MKHWTVEDVMTRDVVSVPPGAPFRDVVNAVLEHRISAVPVVDTGGRVLGIISEADLLHEVRATRGYRARIVRALRRPAEIGRVTRAADLMTAPAVTTGPGASVLAAAGRLEDEKVKRMPVVGDDGRLLGIVSRRDLLRLQIRSDADIRTDVEDSVLRRTLWTEPAAVTVGVDRGTVTLRGRLASRGLADLAVQLTREVAGVVTVVDELSWQTGEDRWTARASHVAGIRAVRSAPPSAGPAAGRSDVPAGLRCAGRRGASGHDAETAARL